MATSPGRCENHRAVLYDRGGTRPLGEVKNLSKVEWSRDRDGTSEASIMIEGPACHRQRGMIERTSSKRHELVIFRGKHRVWEGPIFRIADQGPRIGIFAKDVTAYLFGTMLSQTWDSRVRGGVDHSETVTARQKAIIEYELTHSRLGRALNGDMVNIPGWETMSPPANIVPHLVVHSFPNEARTAAVTRPFETTVGSHLASAARSSGIDFTAVGRSIHLWDTSRSIGRIRTLTEADFFGNVIITEYGADHTQAAYVTGQEGTYGEAVNPENMDFYGPWSTSFSAYNEDGTEAPTVGALNSQAARNTSGRSPVPTEVRIPDNSSVRLSETLSIMDLVPGVQVPLLATLNARARNQLQKLDFLTVTETAAGEDVKITLSPAGRPDSDIEGN